MYRMTRWLAIGGAGLLTTIAALASCAGSGEPTAGAALSGTESRSPATSPVRPLILNAGRPDPAPTAEAGAAPGFRLLEDIDARLYGSLEDPARGRWTALFFVRTDCPISNRYAPEIRRICARYGEDGVECFLVYIDPNATADIVRQHRKEFGHVVPAVLDPDHEWVRRAGATVTPEVAVFAEGARVEYRGRIDDLYAALGRPRRQVTHPDLRDALDDLVAGKPVRTPRTEATGCYIE
jgi:hypothetical protein